MNTGITAFDSAIDHILVNGVGRKTLKPISISLPPIVDLSGLHLTNQFREIHKITKRGRLARENNQQPYTSVVFLHSGNVLDACQYIELDSDWPLAE